MHPASSPEGEQRELPRVQAAFDANDPERARHLRVRHAHGAQGDVLGREAQLLAERGEGLLREFTPQHHLTAKLRAVGEVAEEEVGVGHRGFIAAHVVGGGTWLGTRRVGADAQRAAGIGPCYRAAARADGVDVDHGEFYGNACDHRLRGRLGFAGQDRGDIRARTAHVEGKEVLETAEGAHVGRADDASRRAREDTASGVGYGVVHASYAARGLHYERWRTPGFFDPLRKPPQVGGEPRGQVGIGGRRGEPFVLAELGQDLAAKGDVHFGERSCSASPTRRSCSGCAKAKSRHTATASTSASCTAATAASRLASSSGASSPSGPSVPLR